VLIVAGLSLKNLHPRVWDPSSPCYLPDVQAVMVSYADFHRMAARRQGAMDQGIHAYLGVPPRVKVYLDNGAFFFLERGGDRPDVAYEEFVAAARPDWYPIPQDFIPLPAMTIEERRACFHRTMQANVSYSRDGYVPVVHAGDFLPEYAAKIIRDDRLSQKDAVALGGLVPNLLRAPKALPYARILEYLVTMREAFAGKQVHVFGIGGTATLHLAALLGIDSVDSAGWRNRAARGIVQLPGSGDRMVADLGSWRGRKPSERELETLGACSCPACQFHGVEGLRAHALAGFCNRATHNLWVLLQEAAEVERRIADGSYAGWYEQHLDNSTYLPLIRWALRHPPPSQVK